MIRTMWAENDSDDEIGRFYCNAAGREHLRQPDFTRAGLASAAGADGLEPPTSSTETTSTGPWHRETCRLSTSDTAFATVRSLPTARSSRWK